MVTAVIEVPNAPSNPRAHALALCRLFGFPVLLAALVAGALFVVLPKSNADPDIGWHLRNAQVQIEQHEFLRRDLYSSTTHGAPWIDHEWLAEIPFYLGWRCAGERGVFLVSYVALLAILLGIFSLAAICSGNIKAAFLILLPAIGMASVSFGPRTLLFGWVFLIAELIVLARCERQPGLLWALPPLFLLWVNTHGSWLIGLVLFGLYAASGCTEARWGLIHARRWSAPEMRRLAAAFLLSIVALFANPYGWRLVAYPFNLAFHQRLNIANVVEWRTLDFHTPRGKLALALLAAAIVRQLARPRRWPLQELLFLLVGIYAGFTYSRFLFLAAILILPLLARDLAETIPPYRAALDRPWLNAAVILAVAATVCLHFPANSELVRAESRMYPVAAHEYLQQFHPRGRVLNDYLWGGYLIWNHPQIPVFVDSRVDIFEYSGVFKDYLDLNQLRDSFAILDRYKVRYVLFRRAAPLSYLLAHSSGWKIDYQDETTVLFERRPGAR